AAAVWRFLAVLLPVCLLGALCLVGCRTQRPLAGTEIGLRFIEEDPTEVLSGSQLYEFVPVFDWSFESSEDLDLWQFRPGVDPVFRDGCLVAPAEAFPRLFRKAGFEAKEIDHIELELSGFHTGDLRLFWKSPGYRFNRERQLKAPPRRGHAGSTQAYAFDVVSHPLWQGHITHLQVDVKSSSQKEICLRSIRGSKRSLDGGRLTRTADRPWKVDLDHDVRNALIAPPGLTIEREIDVRSGSRFVFAYGTEPGLEQNVHFRVTAGAADQTQETLFADEVGYGQGNAGVWHEASIDLDDWAGQRIRIGLEVSGSAAQQPGPDLGYWANPVVLQPVSTARPNIVLIVIDTLRADRLSLYGHERETTPRIDRWAQRRATTFHNAVASAPWTLPSHISMFTGLDALSHGHNHSSPLPPQAETVADLLRRQGYATAAITGGAYLHPRYGLAQGFDRFRYWPSKSAQDGELEDGIQRALALLRATPSQPTFLFFHTYEVHSPFRPREPFYSLFSGGQEIGELARLGIFAEPSDERTGFMVRRSFVIKTSSGSRRDGTPLAESQLPGVGDLYDSSLAYADSHIGKLLDEVGDDALVILTSDHGEALGERGLASHAYLYDFNLLVPLIVATPDGRGAGRTVTAQVRSVDLLPTILDLVGFAVPPKLDGRSLRPLMEGNGAPSDSSREAWSYASSTNFGVSLRLSNRLKYHYNNSAFAPIQGQEELYRLGEDPDEQHNHVLGAAEGQRLRQRVFEKLQESFKGLKIDLTNSDSQPHQLHLGGGSVVKPRSVKTLDLGGATVEWNREPRGFVVALPPASKLSLFLEEVQNLETLRVSRFGAEVCRVDAAAITGGEPLRFWLDRQACRPRSGDTPVRGAIEMTLTLSARADPPLAPPPHDPELESKLRALGYLD
ncbi:MAG: sulfatase, partial [Acidobacteriota bacterium]